MGEYGTAVPGVDAGGMRVGIIAGRYNGEISHALLEGAQRSLSEQGVAAGDVTLVWVPGAFEMPVAAQRLAASGGLDAVICLGAVIRGDTPHFDYVAGSCADGLTRVALDTGIPVVFGVLTTDTLQQARDRVGGSAGHKGEEAAATAIEMIDLFRRLPEPPSDPEG